MLVRKRAEPPIPLEGYASKKSFHKDIRRWGPSEDTLLRESYPIGGIPSSREKLPYRSVQSILVRAKRLGLSRSGTGKIKYWTGLDEMKLRRLWGTAPKLQIEKELPGWSWGSIAYKARKLGLFRQWFARFPQHTSNSVIINQIGERMKKRGFTFVDLNVTADVGRTDRFFHKKANPALRSIEKAIEALGGRLIIEWESD